MTPPSAVHHVAVKAADPERVAAFYCDVLGLQEIARHLVQDSTDVRSVWLACGECIVMIERATHAARPATNFAEDPPGLHLLALRIDAAEAAAWRERLTVAGHAVVHATDWTLYVHDPEGNRVGLSWWPVGRPDPARPGPT